MEALIQEINATPKEKRPHNLLERGLRLQAALMRRFDTDPIKLRDVGQTYSLDPEIQELYTKRQAVEAAFAQAAMEDVDIPASLTRERVLDMLKEVSESCCIVMERTVDEVLAQIGLNRQSRRETTDTLYATREEEEQNRVFQKYGCVDKLVLHAILVKYSLDSGFQESCFAIQEGKAKRIEQSRRRLDA